MNEADKTNNFIHTFQRRSAGASPRGSEVDELFVDAESFRAESQSKSRCGIGKSSGGMDRKAHELDVPITE